MKNVVQRVKTTLGVLHRDERGADMIEYILVVAAIALPLLAVVIWFWKDFSQWAKTLWTDAKGRETLDPTDI